MSLPFLLVLCLSAAGYGRHVEFGVPSQFPVPIHWGMDDALQLDWKTIGFPSPDDIYISYNSGESFKASGLNTSISPNLISNASAASQSFAAVHDLGDVGRKRSGSSYSSFNSSFTNNFLLQNGKVTMTQRNVTVSFEGLPFNVSCGKFACPFRLQGTDNVVHPDGTRLQTVIMSAGGNDKSPQATSIVAYTSRDGLQWSFASVVAAASDYTWSEEGPNEHDIILLPNGTVYAVVRVDGGDGPLTHPYRNYYSTISSDFGRSWSPLREIPGVGCARPRLLLLNQGQGPLVLSGGRQKNAGIQAPMMWIDWNMTGADFEPFALSYFHNIGTRGDIKFTSGVNTTTAPRESTCYTSVLSVGLQSGAVSYDVIKDKHHYGFTMPFSIEA